MKKVSRKAYVLSLLPPIIMMIIIFMFSSKTATESDSSSLGIVNVVLACNEKLFGVVAEGNRAETLSRLNHLIRKMAHVTEYMILAILMGIHFIVVKVKANKYFLFNIAICVFYAMTDEFHQRFVEGRSGQISDVGIDSIGVILGTVLLYLICRKAFVSDKLV